MKLNLFPPLSLSMILIGGVTNLAAFAAEPRPHWSPSVGHADPFPLEGIRRCRQCHERSRPEVSASPSPTRDDIQFLQRLEADNWVLLTEMKIWIGSDKHFQAYAVLANEQSKQMAKLLGVPSALRDRRCLACHSGIPLQSLPTEEKDWPIGDGRPGSLVSNLESGVNCEGCHGSGANVNREGKKLREGWIELHDDVEGNRSLWRYRSASEKREAGFVDVRSAASKTEMCLSCHLGDARMGRVITHEMYAAGHPPLPGFEIETFSEQMPLHWQRFENKPAELQKDYLDNVTPRPDVPAAPHVKQLLIGGVVNLRQSLQLLHDLANPEVVLPAGLPKPAWPELATYECSACHHELATKSWRQRRETGLMAGRPFLREWTAVLAGFALTTVGRSEAELNEQLAPLRTAQSAQPFGDRPQLIAACKSSMDWCDALITALEAHHWDKADAVRVQQSAAKIGTTKSLEYDTARQLAWTIQSAEWDLGEPSKELENALKELNQRLLINLHSSRIPFGETEESVAKEVQSNGLPLSLGRIPVMLEGAKFPRNILQLDFARVLQPIAKYDPETIQPHFAKLAALLADRPDK